MVSSLVPDDLIQLGIVLKPHGVRGALKVKPLTTSPERYLLKDFFLEKNSELKFFNSKKVSFFKGFWIIETNDTSSFEEADQWRGSSLKVDEKIIDPLKDDEFFVHDVVGAKVFSKEGLFLGVVKNYFETAANGVCEVDKVEGGEFLFPTTKEILLEINAEEKRVIIEPIPGMIN